MHVESAGRETSGMERSFRCPELSRVQLQTYVADAKWPGVDKPKGAFGPEWAFFACFRGVDRFEIRGFINKQDGNGVAEVGVSRLIVLTVAVQQWESLLDATWRILW